MNLSWKALAALAVALARVGFVKSFAGSVAQHIQGYAPLTAMRVLVAVFVVVHYMFASITAHVTAVLPVMLAVGAGIPGLPLREYALLLCFTLGIMGIISPYATGPSPVCQGPFTLCQRLPAGARLLAAGRDLRRDLPGSPARHRRALAAGDPLIAPGRAGRRPRLT
jgi:hypothetical protein